MIPSGFSGLEVEVINVIRMIGILTWTPFFRQRSRDTLTGDVQQLGFLKLRRKEKGREGREGKEGKARKEKEERKGR